MAIIENTDLPLATKKKRQTEVINKNDILPNDRGLRTNSKLNENDR